MERYRRTKPSSNRSGLPQTQVSSDAEYSDFPPIRQRESSSPAPAAGARYQGRPKPINVSSEEEPSPSQSRRPASTGLGSNNLVNLGGQASPAKRAKPAQFQKPLSRMRPPGSENVENDRPAKKLRLGSSDEAHMRWYPDASAMSNGAHQGRVACAWKARPFFRPLPRRGLHPTGGLATASRVLQWLASARGVLPWAALVLAARLCPSIAPVSAASSPSRWLDPIHDADAKTMRVAFSQELAHP
ncbi:hypothetical protein HYPSUDRAFT_197749 [Hypholoma sublateritium FD-334 SS-4]|uniref:Uncharacterized protein n=1 Tax=Hypholoma sublateritium (strain FD-334 SS-4) TaxID=945553 RepID=A0A0D2LKK2_HYPSF|nr:hypothetical protein HYPSUDRAFT_197749 [Hypholoma sublateritium FD-334 SS-4]